MKTPAGFLFSAVEAAIKKPGRRDLALILSETEASAAGTFTTNRVKAAPVRLCMEKIRSGRGRAIIVNSGNANACTGVRGMKDAKEIVSSVARRLHIPPSLTYMCSTGVIGTPMPMERIMPALDSLEKGTGAAALEDVSSAIMTTDTFPKMLSREITLGRHNGTIAGICKGSGMIAPRMATMLCFLLTDIAVEQQALKKALLHSVKRSFNRITVDGDMSTNDTVIILANGVSGNRPLTAKSPLFSVFQRCLDEITYELGKLIVQDGEGASKLIEVIIKGAKTEKEAETAAFAVANSSLVKTAIYGNDANWGRIMAALGYSGIDFREAGTDIYINKVQVARRGLATLRDKEAGDALNSKNVTVAVDLHSGKAEASVLTCDLTEGYVRINAEYRT